MINYTPKKPNQTCSQKWLATGFLSSVLLLVPLSAKDPFEADWLSLSKHQNPEWFRDAKFGIYTHWGPITVPCEDGPKGSQWYGRNIYMPGKTELVQYHTQKYGDLKSFGYKDIIGLFNPKQFNADEWAYIFKRAGAQFAGPVAIHHDNYAMWDSDVTRWNSMDTAPKQDFVGQLEKAIKKQGMKFIATFHHAWSWEYFEGAHAFDGADPQYADLYCEAHEKGAPPTKRYLDNFQDIITEVTVKYKPDLIWFDFCLGKVIPADYQTQMFANYYNWAYSQGVEVGVAHKHEEIRKYTGIIDFERGREDKLVEYPWLTDTSIGPWFHQKSEPYKSVDELIDILVDIVSKNGCMLLNVGPTADGVIPEEAKTLLFGMGDWLEINGEAIYNTRPWTIYGEGPSKMTKSGGFAEKRKLEFKSSDIRFTRSKDSKSLYAIFLAWPDNRQLSVQSFAPSAGLLKGEIKKVELLGSGEALQWKLDSGGLAVTLPEAQPCSHAFVLKLTL